MSEDIKHSSRTICTEWKMAATQLAARTGEADMIPQIGIYGSRRNDLRLQSRRFTIPLVSS